MNVQEIWSPRQMSASGPIAEIGRAIGGFLCTSSTSGTLQITAGVTSGGATIVASFPVTAGQYYPLPFLFKDGAYAVMTNCAGTFGV